MRVLLIEDDLLLGDALQAGLRGNGFAVEWLRDGESGDPARRPLLGVLVWLVVGAAVRPLALLGL